MNLSQSGWCLWQVTPTTWMRPRISSSNNSYSPFSTIKAHTWCHFKGNASLDSYTITLLYHYSFYSQNNSPPLFTLEAHTQSPPTLIQLILQLTWLSECAWPTSPLRRRPRVVNYLFNCAGTRLVRAWELSVSLGHVGGIFFEVNNYHMLFFLFLRQ